MPELATREPREAVAGDTIKWSRPDLSDTWPPTIWTLQYVFLSRDPAVKFTVSAVNVGGVHVVDLGAAAGLEASFVRVGQSGYEWTARVMEIAPGTEVYTIGRGYMSIEPDVVGDDVDGTEDRRGWATRTLAALKAVIEGRAGADVNMYMLGGKQVSKMTPKELREWFDWVSGLAQAELDNIDPSNRMNRRINVVLNRGF